ncbi:calcium:proton antiporter [Agarivorans sp. MS3-6]|uniref:calcium:proton antiporter n=1 Tax=Agarivorans sp. TSD2052 TaxID=2937286 RepID=UPI00200CF671|nr:calcium:proton antiporter [Agarivorans sp. TSD2052]UPW16730.1 calcium:proton antiporter [Agarivorans sp. TSD2052]
MSRFLKQEYVLVVGILTVLLFKLMGDELLHSSITSVPSVVLIAVLFVVVMASIFAVVRHSDALAIKLGDPYGTLILTLSVVILEVVMISSVMLTGDANPVLARDTMFAVIMTVLNGLVGLTLLLGGLKYHTQKYNIEGLKSYLVAIIPLAILCLILPNFTRVDDAGSMSAVMTATLVLVSISLYAVFLFIQTKSHTHFFIDEDHQDEEEFHGPIGSNLYHALLLIGYLIVVIFLAKSFAIPIDSTINLLGAPQALGGFVVAVLVLAPEAVGAAKAALNNQLQRAMNLFFGSVLATIALTVPAVLLLSGLINQPIHLGLRPSEMVLLCATLMVASLSFSSGKTNSLNGATHLVLFFAYLILMFE